VERVKRLFQFGRDGVIHPSNVTNKMADFQGQRIPLNKLAEDLLQECAIRTERFCYRAGWSDFESLGIQHLRKRFINNYARACCFYHRR
jgi:hypothetical protein